MGRNSGNDSRRGRGNAERQPLDRLSLRADRSSPIEARLVSGTESTRPAAILLTPVLPEPGGSGRAIRAWGWLLELGADHVVHVIVAAPPPEGWKLPAGFPAGSVLWLADTAPSPRSIRGLVGALCPPLVLISPRLMADWFSPTASTFDDLGDIRRIVVFRSYLHGIGLQLGRRYPQAERILDMDDLESATHVSLAGALSASGRLMEALKHLIVGWQNRLIEPRLVHDYAAACLASPDDAALLSRRSGATITGRPNRIPDPGEWLLRTREGPLSLLFVGSLGYFPNEAAARSIIGELVPALREALHQPFRVVIAGRQPTPTLKLLAASVAEVELVADAEQLDPLYARSDIVLVPLRSGGGTKLKTLEAMARRRPVISTAEGVRGLPARPGEHYLAAETTAQFVAAITRVSKGEVDTDAMAEAARQLCFDGFVIG
jgi:glycosyltransferase involved in cell wall biosynthesis